MNGPIGKQMVDTLVESSGNVEVTFLLFLAQLAQGKRVYVITCVRHACVHPSDQPSTCVCVNYYFKRLFL